MKNNFAKALALGLGAVAVLVRAILFIQRGAHVDLTGQMKVRTLATGDSSTLALVDLRITNPSDYPFVVHNITVILETKAGEFPRQIVSRSDAQRLFDSMPEAGPFHPPLYSEASIPAGTTADYTLVAQFNAPERILQDRKRFIVRLERMDGKSFEYSAK